jgi:hypothetical protein
MLHNVVRMDNRLLVAVLEVVQCAFLRHFVRCQKAVTSRKTDAILMCLQVGDAI